MTSPTIPKRSVFFRGADECNVFLERHFWLCAVLFVAQLLAWSIVQDVRTKMWIDELITLDMARLASPGEIIKATLAGCDGAAPLYSMIVNVILPWVRNDALAIRLPSTLAFCGMVLGLLAFCRRRLPAVYSWVAALLACYSCLWLSTDGRSYGAVLGCAAGVLLCWQAAADGRRRMLAVPLLSLFVALMTAMHFYSIFFLVPLFLAELVRWRKSGRLDFAVLAAMLSAPAVVVLHYPLIQATSRVYSGHFWSPARWGSIPAMYANIFLDLFLPPLVVLAVFSAAPEDLRERRAGLTLPEWVAAGAFLLMPFCVLVLSLYTTHIFVERYTVWATIGIAVLVAALLWVAARNKNAVGVSVLALLVALIAFREAGDLWRKPVLRQAEAVRRELALLPDGPEPIVVASHHVFAELSYYAPPRLRERLVYPDSRVLDLRYFGADTGPLLMVALSHRTKLNVVPYDAVLAAHPRFILAATPTDYLPWHLVKAGYRVVPVRPSAAPVLYEVEAPGGE